jgi:hypothetical protein
MAKSKKKLNLKDLSPRTIESMMFEINDELDEYMKQNDPILKMKEQKMLRE